MEQSILVTEALADLFDIPVHEVSEAIDIYESPVILGNNTVEDLKAFAKDVGSKVVLVQYDYADEDELCVEISDEAIEALFGKNANDAKDYIMNHNENIMSEDWSAPYAMVAFVMYEGSAFGIKVYNESYDDELLIEPEDFIACLLDEFEEEECE